MTAFTKDELAFIHRVMSGLPLGTVQRTPDVLVRASAVDEKAKVMRAELAAMPERGELVFSWTIPAEWAMTLNEYKGKKHWALKKIKQAMDADVLSKLPKFPRAMLHGAMIQRWVRCTRFSSRAPDEVSIDSIGGKAALDALTRCGVLYDDNQKFAHREPLHVKTKAGNVHALIEVFAIAEHQVANEGPKDSEVRQIVHTPGPMTRAIMGVK